MMHGTHIETIGELITALQRSDPTAPVRLATQPRHPFENTIGQIVCTPHDAQGHGTPATDPGATVIQ